MEKPSYADELELSCYWDDEPLVNNNENTSAGERRSATARGEIAKHDGVAPMKFQPGQSGNPAERGEDPFPDDPVKSAYVMNGEGLYRQMTEDGCQRTDFDGAASGLVSSDLYSPVNSEHAAEEESRRPTPCPKQPRSRGSPSPHAGVPSAASALELTGRYRPSASPIPPPFAAEGDAASAP
jgi:hypothetical protein